MTKSFTLRRRLKTTARHWIAQTPSSLAFFDANTLCWCAALRPVERRLVATEMGAIWALSLVWRKLVRGGVIVNDLPSVLAPAHDPRYSAPRLGPAAAVRFSSNF